MVFEGGVMPLSEMMTMMVDYVRKLEAENVALKAKLDNARTGQSSLDDLPDILLAGDIAKFMKVSKQTVYEWFRRSPEHGGIPTLKNSRSRRCPKDVFVKWLAEHGGM